MKRAFACLAALAVFALCAGASPAKQQYKAAPNFTLKGLNQEQVELASFKDERPVVLFFWTTWCPYCLRELKHLNRLTEELDQEGIELVCINSGEPAAKVARMVKGYGITAPVYLDEDSKVADRYGIYGVPTFFVIDKKGLIRDAGNSFPREAAKRIAAEK